MFFSLDFLKTRKLHNLQTSKPGYVSPVRGKETPPSRTVRSNIHLTVGSSWSPGQTQLISPCSVLPAVLLLLHIGVMFGSLSC